LFTVFDALLRLTPSTIRFAFDPVTVEVNPSPVEGSLRLEPTVSVPAVPGVFEVSERLEVPSPLVTIAAATPSVAAFVLM
jgi:hypothetical protein